MRRFLFLAMVVTLMGLVSVGSFARPGKDKDAKKKSAERVKVEDLIKKGEFDKAIKLIEKYEKAGTMTAGLYINLGVIYFDQKNYQNAVGAFEKAANLDPFTTKALLYEATCYNKLNDPQKVMETFQRVLEIDPTKTEIQYDLAQLYDRIRQDQNLLSTVKFKDPQAPDQPPKTLTPDEWADKALKVYEDIYNTNPDYKDVAFAAGLILFNKGEFEKAQPYLEKAAAQTPQSDNVILALGQDQLKEQKYKDAATTLAKYLEVAKDDTLKPAVLDQIAVSYENLKDYNNALVYYNKILDMRPNSEKALLGKGNALLQLKKYKEALSVLEQYMKVSHNTAKKEQVEKVIKQLKASEKRH